MCQKRRSCYGTNHAPINLHGSNTYQSVLNFNSNEIAALYDIENSYCKVNMVNNPNHPFICNFIKLWADVQPSHS